MYNKYHAYINCILLRVIQLICLTVHLKGFEAVRLDGLVRGLAMMKMLR